MCFNTVIDPEMKINVKQTNIMKYHSPVCTIFQAFKYCFINSFDFIENKCIFTNLNSDHAHYCVNPEVRVENI